MMNTFGDDDNGGMSRKILRANDAKPSPTLEALERVDSRKTISPRVGAEFAAAFRRDMKSDMRTMPGLRREDGIMAVTFKQHRPSIWRRSLMPLLSKRT